jgi:hypothetical protein
MTTDVPHTDFQGEAKHEATNLLVFSLIALVSLGVGAGLLTLRHFAVSETEAARRWIETPCVIEMNEIVRAANGESRPPPEIVYRYDFRGQTYRGDRLDLLIGSMGDDAAWENRIREHYPPGATAVCYVDPTDPTNSVFDRDNAAKKSRNLWLLAFPFLCAGTCFSIAVVNDVASAFGKRSFGAARAAKRGWGEPPSPPPRKMSLLQRAVVLSGPLGSQMAIPFFVGFTFVFTILDGPNQFAQFIWPETRDQETTGKVTAVRKLDHRELYRSVYEYDVVYEVAGKTVTITSATWGQQYEPGDDVTVTYPSGHAAKGLIGGARESQFLWWHSAIPLAVVLLLALGLLGMYANSFRVMRLLVRGEVARAKWAEQQVAGAINPADDPTKTGYEVPSAVTNYRFTVQGHDYNAFSYGPAPTRSSRKARRAMRRAKGKRSAGNEENPERASERTSAELTEEATVLYHPARPHRNLLFEGYLAKVMRGELSAGDMLLNCAPAPLAALAVWFLFTVR